MAWHNQSKSGAELIMDISHVRWHLLEGFSRCSPTAYSSSIIIELAELLYIQAAPADPVDLSRVATNLRQILRYLGPPAASCNFINTMRKGSQCSRIIDIEYLSTFPTLFGLRPLQVDIQFFVKLAFSIFI